MLGAEAVVKGDEVPSQIGASTLVEASRERLRRPVAQRERLPRRLAARLAVEGSGALELQVEAPAQQLAHPLGPAPLEGGRRRRVRPWGHVGPHDPEHPEDVAVRRPGRERDSATLAGYPGEL